MCAALSTKPGHRNCWINIVIKKCFANCQASPSQDGAERRDKPGRPLGSGPACGMVAGKGQSWLRTLVFVVRGESRAC